MHTSSWQYKVLNALAIASVPVILLFVLVIAIVCLPWLIITGQVFQGKQ